MRRYALIALSLLVASLALAQNDSITRPSETKAVYQGMTLKFDLGATAMTLATSAGRIQSYEIAANWRILNRLYPTFEVGYTGGLRTQGDSLHYRGQGGFARVGIDINPLKKHPDSPHALLVGVRLGTAVQTFTQQNDYIAVAPYHAVQADFWGEVVAGCQVNVYAGLYMGWMARIKFLFTRYDTSSASYVSVGAGAVPASLATPVYIPGFGIRDNVSWGLSYHIGYHF